MTRKTWPWMLVAVLSGALLVYLLGNGSVGLLDRDEPRYAQTSRQMLQSGDWVVPRFLDTIRTAKPIFIYWCQAASMSVFGDNAFGARLPSSVAMVCTLALLAICITREAGSNRGLWTAFIFGTAVLTLGSAKMCLTDSVLLLWTIIGQLCLYRMWRYGVDLRTIVLLGVAVGLAGLTKGPVALGVHLCTLLALPLLKPRREASAFRSPLTMERDFTLAVPIVLSLVLLIVFPWLWMIQMRAPEFLSTTIGHDVVQRMKSGHEGHSGPPGTYSLMVWGTYFPWSLLLPAAIVTAWKNRHLPTTRFALAAWIGPWVMFELIAGKLPHYVLPTYPALAYLTGDMLIRASRRSIKDLSTGAFKACAWAWAVIVIVVGGVGPWAGLVVAKQFDAALIAVCVAASVVTLAMGVATARRFGAGRILAAARAMGGGMAALVALLWAGYMPLYQPIRLSQNVAKIIVDNGGLGQDGYMIDFKEPSLAFHQGGGLREQRDDDYLLHSDPRIWPTWLVLPGRVYDSTPPGILAHWEHVGEHTGIAYTDGGDKRRVVVLRRIDGRTQAMR